MSMNIAGDAPLKLGPNKSGRTMGKSPGTYKSLTTNFMKKSSSTGRIETLAEIKRKRPHVLQPTELKPKLKPDVPKTSDAPVMNLVSSKNFVVANAVETILAAPKKAQQGAKDYLRKEDYGKVPKYLTNIKQDIDAEYDYIRQLQQQEEEARMAAVRPLQEDERMQLIAGLKAKWEAVNTEYQGETHITLIDSHGKQYRKEKWEAQLQQIEKDIERLNKKNIIIHQQS